MWLRSVALRTLAFVSTRLELGKSPKLEKLLQKVLVQPQAVCAKFVQVGHLEPEIGSVVCAVLVDHSVCAER